jgi:hypothetical protein
MIAFPVSGSEWPMRENDQDDFQGTLVEPQGVNAETAGDAEPAREPHDDPPGEGLVPPPPTSRQLNETAQDEMVGLPEQIPGYPGQQRSVDTS